jgi:hypothetical protein
MTTPSKEPTAVEKAALAVIAAIRKDPEAVKQAVGYPPKKEGEGNDQA